MYRYKVFVKDSLDLEGMAIANETCTSFTIAKDLLTSSTSDFSVLNEMSNIKVGDVLGLIDPYGTILYEGVIDSFASTSIQCKELLSLFDDDWLYHTESDSTIEGKISSIITNDFIGSSDPLLASKFPFAITVSSSTTGEFEEQEDNTVMNFESFLNEIYDAYGIIVDISIPFEASTPTIDIKKATNSTIKAGNNMWAIRNLNATSEVVETNKLVIYNSDGDTLRGTYYCTTSGITTNASSPLRLPVIKTKFIFDTDTDLDDIVAANIQEEMYNHKITFDLVLKNNLYDFFGWELGQTIDVWFNSYYYNTIFTGYSMFKSDSEDVITVNIVCGKVRNRLTEILNGR